jgi:hypothetical protein
MGNHLAKANENRICEKEKRRRAPMEMSKDRRLTFGREIAKAELLSANIRVEHSYLAKIAASIQFFQTDK